MKITVITQINTNVYNVNGDKSLLEALGEYGYYLPAACGGRGVCGKCKVRLISGTVSGQTPDKDGYILACKAYTCEDITVELAETEGEGITGYKKEHGKKQGTDTRYGMAFDIGTTTLAACLIGLDTETEYGTYSCLNPQSVYGADVISRIKACSEGKLKAMSDLIRGCANTAAEYFIQKYNIKNIDTVCVCGNTTMLHIFAGESPEGIGQYPFTPVFTDRREYTGKSLGINAGKIILPDSASAYIGSDITCGILASGMCDKDGISLLCDLGTNGELAFYHDGVISCSSTAAGPALEGANIDCGMGGISGAASSFYIKDGKLTYETVNGAKLRGICGSGLVDLVAILLDQGVIDETGAFTDDKRIKEGKYCINDDVYLSGKDVRQFQLVKSAIYSGITSLVKHAGYKLSDIETVYIAGGLGFYIKKESAVRSGLLPAELADKIKIIGNSGLEGAGMCLTGKDSLEKISRIASACDIYDLNSSPEFIDEYVNNMFFEGTENE